MKTTKLVIKGLSIPKLKEHQLISPQRQKRKRQTGYEGFEGTKTKKTSTDFITYTKMTKLVMEGLTVYNFLTTSSDFST